MDKLHEGLKVSEVAAYDYGQAILFSILPDNDNFTEDDATLWEQRLGLISNSSVSLSDRKAAIARKMNHPGDILARASAGYLQQQIQLAGFTDVYVYDNTDGLTIEQFLSYSSSIVQSGQRQSGQFQSASVYSVYSGCFITVQSGQQQSGQFQSGQKNYCDKIANEIDQYQDQSVLVGGDYRSTFFIGGSTLGSFADIPASRKEEFRQLVLKLKRVNKIALLLINYV